MEESTQPNVPMINVPNSVGTGSQLPFCKIWQLFSPWPPDLKLVHSSESTRIGSPGFTSQSLSLSLCWGRSGCYGRLGESTTYCWCSRNLWSPCFDLTERNESTASLLTSMCPGRRRLTDTVPGSHIQCLTPTGSAVYVEYMLSIWLGWWLRLQCAVSVLWVSEAQTPLHPCAVVFNVLVMLHLCLVHLLKTTHNSKYHRFHLCMFFLVKSSYKEVGNHTVLSPVCLWFTKTKQNHIV